MPPLYDLCQKGEPPEESEGKGFPKGKYSSKVKSYFGSAALSGGPKSGICDATIHIKTANTENIRS